MLVQYSVSRSVHHIVASVREMSMMSLLIGDAVSLSGKMILNLPVLVIYELNLYRNDNSLV